MFGHLVVGGQRIPPENPANQRGHGDHEQHAAAL